VRTGCGRAEHKGPEGSTPQADRRGRAPDQAQVQALEKEVEPELVSERIAELRPDKGGGQATERPRLQLPNLSRAQLSKRSLV
jgi:hypothetical protein